MPPCRPISLRSLSVATAARSCHQPLSPIPPAAYHDRGPHLRPPACHALQCAVSELPEKGARHAQGWSPSRRRRQEGQHERPPQRHALQAAQGRHHRPHGRPGDPARPPPLQPPRPAPARPAPAGRQPVRLLSTAPLPRTVHQSHSPAAATKRRSFSATIKLGPRPSTLNPRPTTRLPATIRLPAAGGRHRDH